MKTPPKGRAPRKCWYLLNTPAGSTVFHALEKSGDPLAVRVMREKLRLSGFAFSIVSLPAVRAYSLIRYGIRSVSWLEASAFCDRALSLYESDEIGRMQWI